MRIKKINDRKTASTEYFIIYFPRHFHIYLLCLFNNFYIIKFLFKACVGAHQWTINKRTWGHKTFPTTCAKQHFNYLARCRLYRVLLDTNESVPIFLTIIAIWWWDTVRSNFSRWKFSKLLSKNEVLGYRSKVG